MSSWTASNALTQWVKSIVSKPIALGWRLAARTGKTVWNYWKWAIVETLWSVPKSYNRMKEWFTKSFPKLSNALSKTKNSIVELFGAGKETGKWILHITQWIAWWIWEVFKWVTKGLWWKPMQSLFNDSKLTTKLV